MEIISEENKEKRKENWNFVQRQQWTSCSWMHEMQFEMPTIENNVAFELILWFVC